MSTHYCYIIKCKDSERTYNGYTNNLQRRLRQHCGEISGGAKSTAGRQWEYIAWITSTDLRFDNHMALSLEWYIRHPTGHKTRPSKYNRPSGRIASLNIVLNHPKFKGIAFQVTIHPEYIQYYAG